MTVTRTKLTTKAKAVEKSLRAVTEGIWLYPPYPPSVNGNYRAVAGRVILSAKYRAWKKEALLAYMLTKPPRSIRGPVHIHIVLRAPDKRKRDIDNPLKALLDHLKNVGAIEDDNNSIVKSIDVRWDEGGGVPCAINIQSAAGG